MEGETSPRHYRDLKTWQKAMDLVGMVYKASENWPKTEIYGLTSQIRRGVISIPSNIAEGQGRNGTKEFLHHLSIAHGSLMEVETQLYIANRLGYLSDEDLAPLIDLTGHVGRLLNGLSRSLGGNK